jgi:proline dehydrogenase
MIQNKLILEKLEEKTKNDPGMKKFIEVLIDKETKGGHFTKSYKQLIEKATKEEGE